MYRGVILSRASPSRLVKQASQPEKQGQQAGQTDNLKNIYTRINEPRVIIYRTHIIRDRIKVPSQSGNSPELADVVPSKRDGNK